jgi:penicillin amidase
MSKLWKKIKSITRWLLLLVVVAIVAVYIILHDSLPDLQGNQVVPFLKEPVIITRDEQGIPTIQSKSREDTAYALGYLHAQERFFQMDLLRLKAAGELATLLGDEAMAEDEKLKLHRFRDRARQIVANLPKQQLTLLNAYMNGVNAGLDRLGDKPFEYLLIQRPVKPWQIEDSLLCIFAMYFELNDKLGVRDRSLAVMKDVLPDQWYQFLTPKGGDWDAAMDTSVLHHSAPIPTVPLPDKLVQQKTANMDLRPMSLPGSNSWAVDTALTPYMSAMLANDMHLKLGVPNIWYRASWYLQDGRRIAGVTLPGLPFMVAGSNEQIAWGFTNTYGDWGDIVVLETNDSESQYKTKEGWKNFTIFDHLILSHSGKRKKYLSSETIWGPVIGRDHKGRMLAHQWVAYAPQAANLNALKLEQARSVKDALAIDPKPGMPPQNLIVVDRRGHIGWSVTGAIPRRTDEPNNIWAGYLTAREYPRLIDPKNHRIWTANNRLFAGKRLEKTGFEGGDLGARAQQIRDNLMDKQKFFEADFFNIQLDNQAKFLQRWKDLFSASVNQSKDTKYEPVKALLKQEKLFAASKESVLYALVSQFRANVINQSVGWIFDTLEKQYPENFRRSKIDRMSEYPVWTLVTEKPEHLIPESYSSWEQFLLAAASDAVDRVTDKGQIPYEEAGWGEINQVKIQHPLSAIGFGLGVLLDMPDSAQDGDTHMPKVLGRDFGASMRMVVAPGKEQWGIMHMPAGQSGHPLSSYYSKGHQDWVDGRPGTFLPGTTKWMLELMPKK